MSRSSLPIGNAMGGHAAERAIVARRMSCTEQTRYLLQSINRLGLGNRNRKGDLIMLWTIVVILFVLWLLGFTMSVGGGLIHTLLVIALVIVVFNLITGRRSSV